MYRKSETQLKMNLDVKPGSSLSRCKVTVGNVWEIKINLVMNLYAVSKDPKSGLGLG